MSLEITLRVHGLESSNGREDDTSTRLAKILQDLDGVLSARYDLKTCRFAVRYNPNRITILRILSRIELAGRRTGLDYRPIDVRTGQEDSFASPSPLAEPKEAVHSVPPEPS